MIKAYDDKQINGDETFAPEIVRAAGPAYIAAYQDFFAKHLNQNTNEQYFRALSSFLRYLGTQKILLRDVRASHIRDYSHFKTDKTLAGAITENSLRPHMSAIREYFNECIFAGAIVANPAAAIRTPRRRADHGTTPVIDAAEIRAILDKIELNTQADYRDRALIATMAFSFLRITAVLNLKVENYIWHRQERWFRAAEKGNKIHEIPVHPTLEEYIDAHLAQSDLSRSPKAYLFPSSHGRSGRLNDKQYRRNSAWHMVKRRALDAGIVTPIGNHSFRASGITAYMERGGTLENAQKLAGHSHISTTKLYDRSGDNDKMIEIKKLDI